MKQCKFCLFCKIARRTFNREIKKILASYSFLDFNLDITQRSLFAYFNVLYLIFDAIIFSSCSLTTYIWNDEQLLLLGMCSKEAFVCIRAEPLPLVSLVHILKNFWPFSVYTHTHAQPQLHIRTHSQCEWETFSLCSKICFEFDSANVCQYVLSDANNIYTCINLSKRERE